MGLFDGPITKFAQKFCEYLDARVEVNVAKAKESEDAFDKLRYLVTSQVLGEVSVALKTIAEL